MSNFDAKFALIQQGICPPNTDLNNVFVLTDEQREKMRVAFSPITYDAGGNDAYITEIKKATYLALPENIIDALQKQKTSLDPRPYLVFGNLPFEETTGSPAQGEASINFKLSSLSENLNIAVASLIGEPYSISFEGREIINNLIPLREAAKQFTGLGSDVELSLHIENALLKFLPTGNISPEGLLLQGVRHDWAAPKTHVSDGVKALAMLSDDDKAILREDRFMIKPPARWRDSLKITSELCPILRGNEQSPDLSVAFYSDMVTPQDEKAQAAYDRFYEAAKAVSIWVDVRPGTMVYTDNRLAMHSREAFKANYDENDRAMRWLQRTFVKDSLFNLRDFKREKARVFDPSEKCQRPAGDNTATPSALTEG